MTLVRTRNRHLVPNFWQWITSTLLIYKNCQSFNVFANFLSFNLPNTSRHNTITIRKQLLRSAISKRSKEYRKLIHVRDQLATRVQGILNSVDSYILNRTLHHNVTKATAHFVKTRYKNHILLSSLRKRFVTLSTLLQWFGYRTSFSLL